MDGSTPRNAEVASLEKWELLWNSVYASLSSWARDGEEGEGGIGTGGGWSAAWRADVVCCVERRGRTL
jgi:hypothetical protein